MSLVCPIRLASATRAHHHWELSLNLSDNNEDLSGPSGLKTPSEMCNACFSCLTGTFTSIEKWCPLSELLAPIKGRSRDSLHEPVLADTEREAVGELLGYLENVRFLLAWPRLGRSSQDSPNSPAGDRTTDPYSSERKRIFSVENHSVLSALLSTRIILTYNEAPA